MEVAVEAEAAAVEAEAGFQVRAHFQAHSPRVQHSLRGTIHCAPPPWCRSTTHRLAAQCRRCILLPRGRPRSPLGPHMGMQPERSALLILPH